MIDHLLRFDDYAAAREAFGLAEDDGMPGSVILNVGGPNDGSIRIITAEAVWDMTDPDNPVLTTPESLLPGWWCWHRGELPKRLTDYVVAAFDGDGAKRMTDGKLATRAKDTIKIEPMAAGESTKIDTNIKERRRVRSLEPARR